MIVNILSTNSDFVVLVKRRPLGGSSTSNTFAIFQCSHYCISNKTLDSLSCCTMMPFNAKSIKVRFNYPFAGTGHIALHFPFLWPMIAPFSQMFLLQTAFTKAGSQLKRNFIISWQCGICQVRSAVCVYDRNKEGT
jgi:hypothetical protein